MPNPYAGQDNLEQAWDLGFQYGQGNPEDSDPTPPDFSDWDVDDDTRSALPTVWREGALDGRESAGQEEEPDWGYHSDTDTAILRSEEYPALTLIAQNGDADSWLAAIGVDPASLSDDNGGGVG